ncbi:signal peptidase II [Amnibacterium kyonggiense]|uniref:Lipoprotein signal peptidase n=1 Tax=Amnibacterium kyonggiense TaxID=595671 RepID=A0A4R7FKX8_9MICO|nr:signal peptidase II [Amnibacterium kyonggiense]
MATDPNGPDGASPVTAAPRSASAPVRPGVLALLVAVAVAVLTADQVVKAWVVATLPEGVPHPVIGNLLIFEHVANPGAAFSLATGATWVFSIIAVAVVVFLVWFARRIRSVAWGVLFGLLLGGTLGNLTDRLTRPPGFGVGHVVDFILVPWLLPAIFNLADSAIVISMCLFVLLTLLGRGIDGSRRPARSKG